MSNTFEVTDSRFQPGTTIIETTMLSLSIDLKDDKKTLTANINGQKIILNAYKANDLLQFLTLYQATVAELAEAKNRRAEDADLADMYRIKKEWHQYRTAGDETSGSV